MNSETFRTWLLEQGCRIEGRELSPRGGGHAVAQVRREGRTAELPQIGSDKPISQDEARGICAALGLDWRKLPGPASRA